MSGPYSPTAANCSPRPPPRSARPALAAQPEAARQAAQEVRVQEVDQPVGVPVPGEDDPRAVPAARQGRRVRRHRAELRPRQRPLAQVRAEGVRGDPQDGREDRHRHQRAVLVPVLAVPADQQRPGEARPRAGTGRQDGRGRRTTWAPRTCWSCPARSTSRGGPTTSRCPTTCATSGRRRPSASCSRWPRS